MTMSLFTDVLFISNIQLAARVRLVFFCILLPVCLNRRCLYFWQHLEIDRSLMHPIPSVF